MVDTNAVFTALTISNALAIVMVLLPISWHWKAKNTGTLIYIGWTVLANLNMMINTIVWRGTWADLAPGWCTISSKIIIGQSVGLTAASLCINRKLYNIATIQSVSITRESKRRNMIIDCCFGVLLPIIVMALHYIVQPTKYNIVENVGCWPNTHNSLVAIPTVHMWPIIISCISFVYCTLSIRAFLKARQQFNQVLNNSGTGINMSRYFRLMALASQEMLFSIPISAYFLKQNLTYLHQWPWVSWEDTHMDYGIKIYPTPWILLEGTPSYNSIMASLWVLPVGGFLFFIWFGLGGEAISAYKAMVYKLLGVRDQAKAQGCTHFQMAKST